MKIKESILVFAFFNFWLPAFNQCDTVDFDKNFKRNKYPFDCDLVSSQSSEIFGSFSKWELHDFISFKGGVQEFRMLFFNPDSTVGFEVEGKIINSDIISILSIDNGGTFLLWNTDIIGLGSYEFIFHYFDGYRMVLDVYKKGHKGRKKYIKVGRYLFKKIE